MHEIYLTTSEFVEKVDNLVNNAEGWGTIYDIDKDRLTIDALVGNPLNGLVYMSPVLNTMPFEEYHVFETELKRLSGDTWMSGFLRRAYPDLYPRGKE
jgi:hypothetical protein